MSVVNLPLKEEPVDGRALPLDAAEAQMFRRPSEWRIFWEAFSRDRLAVGAAALIGVVCLISLLAPVLSPKVKGFVHAPEEWYDMTTVWLA